MTTPAEAAKLHSVDASGPPKWRRRPDGANWGDFGPDDRIGRINLLTPETVRAAVAEVRTGERFCLSLPLDLPGGTALNRNRWPPVVSHPERSGRPTIDFPLALEQPGCCDIVSDERVDLATQYSTHWDSLGHVGQTFDANGDGQAEVVYYNGHCTGAGAAPQAGPALDIDDLAATAVQGRGVMIDLLTHFGPERRAIGFDALMTVLKSDNVVVEPGDLLCLHTGYAQAIVDMGGRPDRDRLMTLGAGLDGADLRLIDWIDQTGLAAIAADNSAVEIVRPFDGARGGCAALPLHDHCLFRRGIHLGEYWYLTPLATWLRAHERSRFLLTAPPLRLPGAVGSPVTPVATV